MSIYRLFFSLGLLLSVSACVTRAPNTDIYGQDKVCLAKLESLGVTFETQAPFGNPGGGCGISTPVKVSGIGVGWNNSAVLNCSLARSMVRFEKEILQPLAKAHFGQKVTKIYHMGTYSCRAQRNGTTQAAGGEGRISEHAKGLAIDISGFELRDGTRMFIKNDWRNKGKISSFLQELSRRSCSVFNVVLSPNYNSYHKDHLHFDLGKSKMCR